MNTPQGGSYYLAIDGTLASSCKVRDLAYQLHVRENGKNLSNVVFKELSDTNGGATISGNTLKATKSTEVKISAKYGETELGPFNVTVTDYSYTVMINSASSTLLTDVRYGLSLKEDETGSTVTDNVTYKAFKIVGLTETPVEGAAGQDGNGWFFRVPKDDEGYYKIAAYIAGTLVDETKRTVMKPTVVPTIPVEAEFEMPIKNSKATTLFGPRAQSKPSLGSSTGLTQSQFDSMTQDDSAGASVVDESGYLGVDLVNTGKVKISDEELASQTPADKFKKVKEDYQMVLTPRAANEEDDRLVQSLSDEDKFVTELTKYYEGKGISNARERAKTMYANVQESLNPVNSSNLDLLTNAAKREEKFNEFVEAWKESLQELYIVGREYELVLFNTDSDADDPLVKQEYFRGARYDTTAGAYDPSVSDNDEKWMSSLIALGAVQAGGYIENREDAGSVHAFTADGISGVSEKTGLFSRDYFRIIPPEPGVYRIYAYQMGDDDQFFMDRNEPNGKQTYDTDEYNFVSNGENDTNSKVEQGKFIDDSYAAGAPLPVVVKDITVVTAKEAVGTTTPWEKLDALYPEVGNGSAGTSSSSGSNAKLTSAGAKPVLTIPGTDVEAPYFGGVSGDDETSYDADSDVRGMTSKQRSVWMSTQLQEVMKALQNWPTIPAVVIPIMIPTVEVVYPPLALDNLQLPKVKLLKMGFNVKGVQVKAAAAGEVKAVGYSAALGNYVVIKHIFGEGSDNEQTLYTVYGNLGYDSSADTYESQDIYVGVTKVAVIQTWTRAWQFANGSNMFIKQGDKVVAGQPIGFMGATGKKEFTLEFDESTDYEERGDNNRKKLFFQIRDTEDGGQGTIFINPINVAKVNLIQHVSVGSDYWYDSGKNRFLLGNATYNNSNVPENGYKVMRGIGRDGKEQEFGHIQAPKHEIGKFINQVHCHSSMSWLSAFSTLGGVLAGMAWNCFMGPSGINFGMESLGNMSESIASGGSGIMEVFNAAQSTFDFAFNPAELAWSTTDGIALLSSVGKIMNELNLPGGDFLQNPTGTMKDLANKYLGVIGGVETLQAIAGLSMGVGSIGGLLDEWQPIVKIVVKNAKLPKPLGELSNEIFNIIGEGGFTEIVDGASNFVNLFTGDFTATLTNAFKVAKIMGQTIWPKSIIWQYADVLNIDHLITEGADAIKNLNWENTKAAFGQLFVDIGKNIGDAAKTFADETVKGIKNAWQDGIAKGNYVGGLKAFVKAGFETPFVKVLSQNFEGVASLQKIMDNDIMKTITQGDQILSMLGGPSTILGYIGLDGGACTCTIEGGCHCPSGGPCVMPGDADNEPKYCDGTCACAEANKELSINYDTFKPAVSLAMDSFDNPYLDLFGNAAVKMVDENRGEEGFKLSNLFESVSDPANYGLKKCTNVPEGKQYCNDKECEVCKSRRSMMGVLKTTGVPTWFSSVPYGETAFDNLLDFRMAPEDCGNCAGCLAGTETSSCYNQTRSSKAFFNNIVDDLENTGTEAYTKATAAAGQITNVFTQAVNDGNWRTGMQASVGTAFQNDFVRQLANSSATSSSIYGIQKVVNGNVVQAGSEVGQVNEFLDVFGGIDGVVGFSKLGTNVVTTTCECGSVEIAEGQWEWTCCYDNCIVPDGGYNVIDGNPDNDESTVWPIIADREAGECDGSCACIKETSFFKNGVNVFMDNSSLVNGDGELAKFKTAACNAVATGQNLSKETVKASLGMFGVPTWVSTVPFMNAYLNKATDFKPSNMDYWFDTIVNNLGTQDPDDITKMDNVTADAFVTAFQNGLSETGVLSMTIQDGQSTAFVKELVKTGAVDGMQRLMSGGIESLDTKEDVLKLFGGVKGLSKLGEISYVVDSITEPGKTTYREMTDEEKDALSIENFNPIIQFAIGSTGNADLERIVADAICSADGNGEVLDYPTMLKTAKTMGVSASVVEDAAEDAALVREFQSAINQGTDGIAFIDTAGIPIAEFCEWLSSSNSTLFGIQGANSDEFSGMLLEEQLLGIFGNIETIVDLAEWNYNHAYCIEIEIQLDYEEAEEIVELLLESVTDETERDNVLNLFGV